MISCSAESVHSEIIKCNLRIRTITQDIRNCDGSVEDLNDLGYECREAMNKLRKHIDQLEMLAKEKDKKSEMTDLLNEVKNQREQLTSLQVGFRKATLAAMILIDKKRKEELFDGSSSQVKHRIKRDKESLVKSSMSSTEKLLALSRNLSETVQRSAGTVETLVNSSHTIHETQEEFKTMGTTISKSHQLLTKYGRREITDKVLIVFALIFFFACVLYIVQKRLF